MYTDFNIFFTVRTRNLWRIKRILGLPPHLYSVTALPSKTYTTANIDAHVWLLAVNGPSATTKVTLMRLINNIQVMLQCSICSCILRGFTWLQGLRSIILPAYHDLNHWNVISCPERPRTATAWLPFSWPAVVNFFSQTIHTCHRPSFVRKLFLWGVWPPFFSLFVDPLSNCDRPSLFCPFKPSKMIKTIKLKQKT